MYKKLREIVAAASDHDARENSLSEAKHVVEEVCIDHVAAADMFIRDPQLNALLKADTEMECQLLVDYLEAAKRFNLEINSRAKDRVVSFGEKLSCRFMTCLLKDRVSSPANNSPVFFMLTRLSKGGGCRVHRPGRHHAL